MPKKTQRAPSDPSPAFLEPMPAHLVQKLPEGADWMYELKLDGYRALIIKDGKQVAIRSRNDKDLAKMYPSIAARSVGHASAAGIHPGAMAWRWKRTAMAPAIESATGA